MVVLDIKCVKCNHICNSIHFQFNFENWTSGNKDIDKFIQSTQLSAHNVISGILEWISYDRLYNIKCITESNTISKFNDKVYRANWIDGYINKWDNNNQNWIRDKPNIFVILKALNNPASIMLEPINKVL
jgi:hypothetical protein